jgi:hypothetical protein
VLPSLGQVAFLRLGLAIILRSGQVTGRFILEEQQRLTARGGSVSVTVLRLFVQALAKEQRIVLVVAVTVLVRIAAGLRPGY